MSTGSVSSSGGLLVAARAVALRPADHDQALAEIADVDLERGELAVVEPDPRDVDEDDAVVRREAREVGRERLGDEGVDLLALVLSAATSSAATLSSPARTSVRGSPLTMVFESARSFSLNVSRAASTTARNVWKPASVGLTSKVIGGRTRGEIDGLGRGERPVGEQADGRGLGDVRPDVDGDRHRLAEARRRRRRQPLDEHLVDVAETDPAGLDADALRRGERGFGLAAAGRVVAVGEQDDPLLGVVREERGREAEGGADVGGRLDRRGREAVDLGQVGRQALDEGLLAERDDPGDVAIGPLLERLAQEREGVLATGVADRIGHVDDEDGREPVDRQDQLEAGQREDEGREKQRPDDERDAPATRAHPATRTEMEADRQQQRRDEQEERERRIERDAHQVPPSVAPAPEPRTEPAAQPDERVTVVDGPFDAQPEEHEEDDREPELVARGRAGLGGRLCARVRGRAGCLR